MILKRIYSFLESIIAPRKCHLCGELLVSEERMLCTKCLMALPRTHCHLSPNSRLSQFIDNGIAIPGFTAAWFLYAPTTSAAKLIVDAKYHSRPWQARTLGRIFGAELLADASKAITKGAMPITNVDILLPVPMHPDKILTRGFNQAEEIALGISDITGIPVADNIIATKPHATQTRRSKTSRRENIKQIYSVVEPQHLDGMNVVIVDDVITSGATINECIMAISRSGAKPASFGALCLGLAGGV